ncbi:hypothetical protein ACSQ67_021751 [Phaseolus vulgaris]
MIGAFHKTNTNSPLFFPMGIFIWKSLVLVSLCTFFFTCEVSATSTQLISNLTQDVFNPCDFVYCGKGTCHLSSTELLGFTCDCESGWKKPTFASFQLPPCVLPNCTVDLNCGNDSPSLPSSPPTQVNDRTLGGDCSVIDLGFGSSPTQTQPPPETSGTADVPGGSSTAGSGETLRCIRGIHMLATLILALTFEIWI